MRSVAAPFPQKASAFRGPQRKVADFLIFCVHLCVGTRTREGASVKPECPVNIPVASVPKATEWGAEDEACKPGAAGGRVPPMKSACNTVLVCAKIENVKRTGKAVTPKGGEHMTDYELIMIGLTFSSLILTLLIAYIKK